VPLQMPYHLSLVQMIHEFREIFAFQTSATVF
jgi:hypothetical protein